MRYRFNTPRFVDETIDGEALIMDMVKGSYYSCDGASAVAWNALRGGEEVEAVVALLADRYGIPPERAAQDLAGFVDQLVAGELLVVLGDGDARPGPPEPPGLGASGSDPGGREYVGLALECHTDLADIILLDPVHDVTDAGWPHARDANSGG
ncbi:MAG: hypothetical protein AMXMBFR46_12450 [Acidimicrobiia bacterium]